MRQRGVDSVHRLHLKMEKEEKDEGKSLRQAEVRETKGQGAEQCRETGWCHRELMDSSD